MSENSELVKLADIRIDGGTQSRVTLNEDVIAEYKEHLKELPPVKLYWDGSHYWLWDGYHRYFANKQSDVLEILAIVEPGTKKEAVLASLGANHNHGLPRTRADKKKAIETILNDDEWVNRPTSWIAEKCNVSQELVRKMRPKESHYEELDSDSTKLDAKTAEKVAAIKKAGGTARVGISKQGKPRVMDTSKIGKTKAPKEEPKVVEPAEVDETKPWAEFEAQIRKAQQMLRLAANVVRDALEYDAETKQMRSKWAADYSYQGTVGAINQLVRELDNGLPVETEDSAVGYVNARRAALAKRAA